MTRHRHDCACGSFFQCAASRDQCAIAHPYVCPNCLQDQQDDYFNVTYPTLTQQEPLHEHQHRIPEQVPQGRRRRH